MYNRRNHTTGLTLIELLISVTIGFLILSAIYEIFLAVSKNHLANEALTEIRENSNIAINFLNNSIRLAGYSGCSHHFPFNPIDANAHSISVRYASNNAATLLASMQDNRYINVSQNPKLLLHKKLFISNCKTSEMFAAKSILHDNNSQKIEVEQPLQFRYEVFSEVSQLESKTFHVANTGRFDPLNQPIYALYANKTELVEGVNEIQFRYSVLIDNKVVEKSADELNHETIVGVSIELTMHSLNQFNLNKKVYSYVALREI